MVYTDTFIESCTKGIFITMHAYCIYLYYVLQLDNDFVEKGMVLMYTIA